MRELVEDFQDVFSEVPGRTEGISHRNIMRKGKIIRKSEGGSLNIGFNTCWLKYTRRYSRG